MTSRKNQSFIALALSLAIFAGCTPTFQKTTPQNLSIEELKANLPPAPRPLSNEELAKAVNDSKEKLRRQRSNNTADKHLSILNAGITPENCGFTWVSTEYNSFFNYTLTTWIGPNGSVLYFYDRPVLQDYYYVIDLRPTAEVPSLTFYVAETLQDPLGFACGLTPTPTPTPEPTPSPTPTPTPSPSHTPFPISLDASSFFSPDGDGEDDVLQLTIGVPLAAGNWTLSIDGVGIIASGSGNASISWSGILNDASDDEAIIADGSYTVHLRTSLAEVSVDVFVDREEVVPGDVVANLGAGVGIALRAYAIAKVAFNSAKLAFQRMKAAWKVGQASDAEYAAARKAMKDAQAERLRTLKEVRESRHDYKFTDKHGYVTKPTPKEVESFGKTISRNLEQAQRKTSVEGGGGLRPRWKDEKGNIWEWDSRHGEYEKYTSRGSHIGSYSQNGTPVKGAVPNRSVEP